MCRAACLDEVVCVGGRCRPVVRRGRVVVVALAFVVVLVVVSSSVVVVVASHSVSWALP